ncbi:26S proteasome regulatory subunit N12 [Capronia epimyces CBS 606.96]|uniref:26S proteasome regulatory subunit N12 n=1 Tax=Capronia epimyces CBS 606.96 TaxID=1182542 RepID=W9Y7D5_9EURO|nr:26S proteasome regulatory subunit N12 [Capronia epimyces CBS 606.96]EXJ85161.1 26S proteasome regulatory subunit N12 [Capronia epimyces CBS 606.96]
MATNAPSLESILHTLQQYLSHGDSSQSQPQLQKAKLALLHHNALIPSPQTPVSTLATARSILEAGALLSIRSRDPEAFVRYHSQLQPFYDFPGLQQTPSPTRSKITGLYLLLLLSQGDYAGFHTLLESLVVAEGADGASSIEEDQYIKYPIELERNLMEGSYDQVWRKTNGRDVPGEEFALFSDILINTIRLEIASCATRSYPSLPIASAKNLLFLDSEGAVTNFAREQGWSLEEGRIYFPGLGDAKKAEEGDQKEVVSHVIEYARELEMIV